MDRFSKPIAHGMYSISRCLAELGEHYLDSSSSATISYPLIVSVQFKKPLFLPANDVRLVHDIHDITTTNGGDDSSNENNLVGLDSSAITHCSELLGFEDHNNNNNNNDDTKKCLSFALLSSTGAPHLKAVAYPWNYTKPTTTK